MALHFTYFSSFQFLPPAKRPFFSENHQKISGPNDEQRPLFLVSIITDLSLSPGTFMKTLKEYIDYYNSKSIKSRLKEKSPVQYRTLSITG